MLKKSECDCLIICKFTFVKDTNHPLPVIVEQAELILAGLKTTMSLSHNTTIQLWQTFGPLKKSIHNKSNGGSYSVQCYVDDFMSIPFTPETKFVKWAAVAVFNEDDIPKELEVLKIPKGKWAVFPYKGTTRDFGKFAQYVYQEWLPQSGYQLDHRPHYEYMGSDYLGPNHPDAQEDVWIPIV
jgi:AraC family transcriptional regulator